MAKARCFHPGCIRGVKVVIPIESKRNTTDKQHECCGRCCPNRRTTRG